MDREWRGLLVRRAIVSSLLGFLPYPAYLILFVFRFDFYSGPGFLDYVTSFLIPATVWILISFFIGFTTASKYKLKHKQKFIVYVALLSLVPYLIIYTWLFLGI